jgi:hypothetical protein
MSTAPPPGDFLPGGIFQSLTQRPASHFSVGDVPAPTSLYCPDDSFMRITVFALAAGAQVKIDYFILRSFDGDTSTGEEIFNVPTSGQVASRDIPLVEGFLMGVTMLDLTGQALRGNVFATAQLMRGTAASNRVIKLLFADYVVTNQPTGYPFGRTTQSIDGHGAIVHALLGPAAAGQEAGLTGTAPQQRFSLNTAMLTFVASAAPANRVPEFRLLRNAADIVWRMPFPGNITAGQTVNITLMCGGPSPVLIGTNAILPLPTPTLILPADEIVTVTAGIQAGDQYTVVNVSGEEWVNG